MDSFDIVVIGGGSAGCALGSRLAARTDLRIALIEAGPDYGPRTSGSWPADLLDAHHTPDSHDWGLDQPRARVIGGCSVHNECALVRALPGDYERWAVPGWSDSDLTAVIEDVVRAVPSSTRSDDDLAAWQRAFLDSAVQAGFPRIAAIDDPQVVSGLAPFPQNIVDGIRFHAAFAFLDRARSRITIISNVVIDRFSIEGDRARRLFGYVPDGAREIHAKRFVLCAGVYGSAAVLLRSGAGPADQLGRLKIPIRMELPGVGANLHDHPGVDFEYEPTRRALRATRADAAAGRFYEAQVVLRSAPDLHIVPYQSRNKQAWSFGILAYYMNPRSRGRMRLISRDPRAPVKIDSGLLTDRHDTGVLVEAVQLVHGLTRCAPLSEAIKSGPHRFTARSRQIRFVRNHVTAYAHAAGTCRMGPSPTSGDVVDARGRVHGLANVFVADAAIIPRIPRANTNFTCYVIGTRVADLLEVS